MTWQRIWLALVVLSTAHLAHAEDPILRATTAADMHRLQVVLSPYLESVYSLDNPQNIRDIDDQVDGGSGYDKASTLFLRFSLAELCDGERPLSISGAFLTLYAAVEAADQSDQITAWNVSLLDYADVPALDTFSETLPPLIRAGASPVDVRAFLAGASTIGQAMTTSSLASLLVHYYAPDGLNAPGAGHVGFALAIERNPPPVDTSFDFYTTEPELQPALLVQATCPPPPVSAVPEAPTALSARQTAGVVPLVEDGWLASSSVLLSASVDDDSPSVKLQFQLDGPATSFPDFPTTYDAAGADCLAATTACATAALTPPVIDGGVVIQSLEDGRYLYRARAIDPDDNTSPATAAGSFRVDTTPPSSPVFPTVTPHGWTADADVNFDWNAATDGGSGVVAYEARLCPGTDCNDPTCTTTATVTGPQATLTLSAANIEYRACARAEDAAGNVGGWAITAQTLLLDDEPPSAPDVVSGPAAVASGDDVTWSWSVATDSGSGISKYFFSACTDAACTSGCTEPVIATVEQTTLSGLADGAWYGCVYARDGVGFESPVTSTSTPTVVGGEEVTGPTRLVLGTNGEDVPVGACVPFSLWLKNDQWVETASATNVVVDLTTNLASTFHTDAECASASVHDVEFPAGETYAARFVKPSEIGTYELTASTADDSLLPFSTQIEVLDPEEFIGPIIEKSAVTSAAVGVPYAYDEDRRASSDDADATWSKVQGPASFAIDAISGLITWTPSEPGEVVIELMATNEEGDNSYLFVVDVLDASQAQQLPTPIALVTPVSGDAPLAIQADGRDSTAGSGRVLNAFEWNFGDGTALAYGGVVDYTYARPGGYVARLLVRDDLGVEASALSDVIVARDGVRPPSARISMSVVERGEGSLTARFTCTCSAGDNALEAWRWTFGDGAVSSDEEATHTFGSGGYLVRFVVTDAAGLTGEDQLFVEVAGAEGNRPPQLFAYASTTTGPAPLEVGFSAAFVDPDEGDAVASLAWDFGDGDVVDGDAAPEHGYGAPGVYTVVVTATDEQDLSSQASIDVVVTDALGNVPPEIVSLPTPAASAGTAYVYDADDRPSARGSRPLTWSLGKRVGGQLLGAPAGMAIDESTGVISYTPAVDGPASVDVVIVVANAAGDDVQEWTIAVRGVEGPLGEECSCRSSPRADAASASPIALALLALLLGARRRRRRS